MAGVSCVLSEDQFLCSICLEVFTDPVTTACGHSFCNICINKHWNNRPNYHCPVCNEEFSSRPQIKTSTFVSEMVSEFKNKRQRADIERSEQVAGAGDVSCDVCPEPKLKALKCCLMCQTSYCPNHLTPHNTVPRLKKHQLIAPVVNLEERLCPEHERLLDLFCKDHSHFMCLQCCYTDHNNHNTVPLKEQCEEEQSELQQKIQERKEKILKLQRSVELSQENADREIKKGVKFFNDLMKSIQQSLNWFKQSIIKKHQEIKEKAEELMKKIKSEISALEQRRAQMEKIWSSDDYFHFVETFTLDKLPELNDWTEVSVRAPSYEGRVGMAVSDLQITKLNPEIKNLCENELKKAKQHVVSVTLDPNTAHPELVVSKDRKRVHRSDQTQNLKETRGRFLSWFYVCGKQQFSSGKFYFEVQAEGNNDWYLGVVNESADRKVDPDETTEQNGFWEISGETVNKYRDYTVNKVGVFVDYDEGLICFYDLFSSLIIDSFTECCFTESILPLFSPGDNGADEDDEDDEDDENGIHSSLMITPVTV